MSDAVLPAFCLRGASFVGVGLEPLVDIAEDHCIVWRVQEGLVDELRVGLLFVNDAVSGEIVGMSRGIVMRSGCAGQVGVWALVAIIILNLHMRTIWMMVKVVAELHELAADLVV